MNATSFATSSPESASIWFLGLALIILAALVALVCAKLQLPPRVKTDIEISADQYDIVETKK